MKATTNLKQPSALTLNHCSYVTYPIHLDNTYLLTSQVSSYVNISLCHFNGIQTHNHLVRKWTLKHVAKFNHNYLASFAKRWRFPLRAKWLWFQTLLKPVKPQILRLFQARSLLILRQLQKVYSLSDAYVAW